MPMNSSHISHCSTLMPDAAALLQGLKMDLQNIRIKVIPTSIVSLQPVYSNCWMTRVEYISKEVRHPSHKNVDCDFL